MQASALQTQTPAMIIQYTNIIGHFCGGLEKGGARLHCEVLCPRSPRLAQWGGCARRRRALSRGAPAGMCTSGRDPLQQEACIRTPTRLWKQNLPGLWTTVMSSRVRMLGALLDLTNSFGPGLQSVSQAGSARQAGHCCPAPRAACCSRMCS